jgi:hypothetical protein
MRRFQRVHSISVIGLRGGCWWAAPQPRLLPRHNIAGVGEGRQTYVCPPSSTRDSDEERGRRKLIVGRSVTAAAHVQQTNSRIKGGRAVRVPTLVPATSKSSSKPIGCRTTRSRHDGQGTIIGEASQLWSRPTWALDVR